MKKLLLSLLGLFSVAVFAGNVTDISREALLKADTSDWLILDVRTAKEYRQGHIPGAVNLSHQEVANNLDKILTYKDKPVVVYCKAGYRAGKAAKVLLKNGFTQVKHLEGDMSGWEKAGLEIEK